MAVIIEPDEGTAAEIGQQLLAMAEHYSEVRWVTWPKTGFLVAEELAVKLKDARSEESGQEPEQVTPARRRAGRPRKQQVEPAVEDTDDTEDMTSVLI